MFHFSIKNDLISQSLLGFKPRDYFVNQLLSVALEIYKSFDDGFDVRTVFLDISKGFDKVWHEGIKKQMFSGNITCHNIISDIS